MTSRHESLLADVKQLRADFRALAISGHHAHRDAYADAEDMTRFVLDKDKERDNA